MQISAIYRYPLKSATGLSLAAAELDGFGLVGDRRWMLVDPEDRFVSQRELAALATLGVEDTPERLVLLWSGERLTVPCPADPASLRQVQIWNDRVDAFDAGDEAADWLGARFRRPLRLVKLADSARRRVDPEYAGPEDLVGFADGFPLLLTTEGSLADLNARLHHPVPMNRFRPNLVVAGAAAFAEDGWRILRIGELEFTVAKPCSRCVIPSIDQATGERDLEINRVLAGFRRRDGAVYFGQNLLAPRSGRIRVGDGVEVVS